MATISQICLSLNRGGLEIYVERISAHLAQRGHRVRVVTLAGSYLAERLPADLKRPISPPGVGDGLRLGFQVSQRVLAEQTDVVHVHGGRELPYAVLAKLRSHRPIRLAYSRHIVLNRSKKDLWHRMLYRQVDAYLAVSEQIANQALQRVPISGERVHVLHHGVETASRGLNERAAARARMGFPDNCFLVGLFSRIEHAKGQHTLVEAVSLLRQKDIKVQAFILGHVSEPAYRQHLAQRVRELNLDAQLVFLDFVPEAHRLMSACDAVVVPSKEEGFALVAAEAMSAEVPVVGTRGAGGILNLIEHQESGLLFEWEDAATLAQHLEALHRDPQLGARLARNGYELISRSFIIKNHVDALETHLLGGPAPLNT